MPGTGEALCLVVQAPQHGPSAHTRRRTNPPGNRPVQLKKSTWDDRQVKDKTGKPIKRLVEEKAKKPDKRARAGASFEAGVGPPVQQAFYTRR